MVQARYKMYIEMYIENVYRKQYLPKRNKNQDSDYR